jgi:hypothetical protein
MAAAKGKPLMVDGEEARAKGEIAGDKAEGISLYL